MRCSMPASTGKSVPSWTTMAARVAPVGITSHSRCRAPAPTSTSYDRSPRSTGTVIIGS